MLKRLTLIALLASAHAAWAQSTAPIPPSPSTRPAAAAPDDRSARIAERLRPILEAFQARSGFPGGGIGFALADGTIGALAVGMADVENAVPMRIDHRLPAGSAGKTFFAAVALQLMEERQLELDAPIARYLGERAWFKRLPNADTVTFRTLMNHSSGIPEHVQMREFTAALHDQPEKSWTPDELVTFVLDKPALFEAGKGWSYADTNYILLGMIVEKVTGEKAYDLVTKHVLQPRGLSDVLPQDRRELPNLACGYMQVGRSLIEIDDPRTVIDGRFFMNPQFEWCGGGFVATSRDLARWTFALWGGDLVLRENTREAALEGLPARTGRDQRYGLGVQIRPTAMGMTFGHGGYFPGSMTETAYFAEHGFALAIMVNSDHHTSPRSLLQCLSECAEAIVANAKP